jgi:acylphosphatase
VNPTGTSPAGDHPANDAVRRRVRIVGRVQGVGFRETCRREAIRLGVGGQVRNLGDGSVEAVFEGPAGAVAEMVAWCRRGPRLAQVRQVDVWEETPAGASGFAIGY